MESLFSMIKGPKSIEATSLQHINQKTIQNFLSKIVIWDFYELTREEYTKKSADDKKLLILNYYDQLLSGIFFVICFLVAWSLLLGFKFWFNIIYKMVQYQLQDLHQFLTSVFLILFLILLLILHNQSSLYYSLYLTIGCFYFFQEISDI